ncbi:hypothetical protein G7Y89_g15313 [Cudoniella acicularis]|uniref:Uncharacterized protein n=1 Tax=Cudoniella acicularis TaxID=354080 RepID=A0A8H4QQY9_9HELO|nr:hypothetical protein G7Y89_g15313 [Cudoniella acicularis]
MHRQATSATTTTVSGSQESSAPGGPSMIPWDDPYIGSSIQPSQLAAFSSDLASAELAPAPTVSFPAFSGSFSISLISVTSAPAPGSSATVSSAFSTSLPNSSIESAPASSASSSAIPSSPLPSSPTSSSEIPSSLPISPISSAPASSSVIPSSPISSAPASSQTSPGTPASSSTPQATPSNSPSTMEARLYLSHDQGAEENVNSWWLYIETAAYFSSSTFQPCQDMVDSYDDPGLPLLDLPLGPTWPTVSFDLPSPSGEGCSYNGDGNDAGSLTCSGTTTPCSADPNSHNSVECTEAETVYPTIICNLPAS